MTETRQSHLVLSRRAIAPVFTSTDMLTTGAIAHRLIVSDAESTDMLTTGAIAHRLIVSDAELDELSGEIMEMLQEVHS